MKDVSCLISLFSPLVQLVVDVLGKTVRPESTRKETNPTFGNVTLGTITVFNALGAFLGACDRSPLGWY